MTGSQAGSRAVLATFVGAGMGLILSVGESAAQRVCGPAADILRVLENQRGEYIVFRGLDRAGRPVVVTRSKKGNWSILTVFPDSKGRAIACFNDTGTAGELIIGDAV